VGIGTLAASAAASAGLAIRMPPVGGAGVEDGAACGVSVGLGAASLLLWA